MPPSTPAFNVQVTVTSPTHQRIEDRQPRPLDFDNDLNSGSDDDDSSYSEFSDPVSDLDQFEEGDDEDTESLCGTNHHPSGQEVSTTTTTTISITWMHNDDLPI
jgi:hypothetical protein